MVFFFPFLFFSWFVCEGGWVDGWMSGIVPLLGFFDFGLFGRENLFGFLGSMGRMV